MRSPFASFFLKMVRPAARRVVVAHLQAAMSLSEQRRGIRMVVPYHYGLPLISHG